MANRILYTNSTSVTGRALKEILGIQGSTNPGDARVDTLIRWGSATRSPKKPRRIINKRTAVEVASNKLTAFDRLIEGHVRIPPIFKPEQINHHTPFPLLARRARGQGGKDIVLCMQRSDIPRMNNVSFYSHYIPTAREFRVHVFQGEVLKISEKILTDEEKFKVPWIRNFDNGYTFRQMRNDLPAYLKARVRDTGIHAVEAMGLDFGAADVILGDDGEVYVLEINTGPGLSDNSLEVYARKFAELLEIPENRLNWPEDMELVPNGDERMEDPDPAALDRML